MKEVSSPVKNCRRTCRKTCQVSQHHFVILSGKKQLLNFYLSFLNFLFVLSGFCVRRNNVTVTYLTVYLVDVSNSTTVSLIKRILTRLSTTSYVFYLLCFIATLIVQILHYT
jgi:hypothetical protein